MPGMPASPASHVAALEASERRRHRASAVVLVDGVPLPNPKNTGNLLVGSIIGRWLDSHRDAIHGTVLDLGCGNRPYAPWYEPLADLVIAADPAPGADPNVWAMADQVPLRSDCIDSVLCTEVLEHVERLEHAVSEMYRVLRPGGEALITVPFLYPTHEAPYDFQRLTHIGLRSIMVRHGFEVVDQACNGGPGTLVGSWLFRGLRIGIDVIGKALGVEEPISFKAPFSWLVMGPQKLILRLRPKTMSRMTKSSQLVSTGYMVRVSKPL